MSHIKEICPCCGYSSNDKIKGLFIETRSGWLHFGGKKAHLSQREADILQEMIENHPRAQRASHLIDAVWGHAGIDIQCDNIISVHLSHIRKKFRAAGIPLDVVNDSLSLGIRGYRLKVLEDA